MWCYMFTWIQTTTVYHRAVQLWLVSYMTFHVFEAAQYLYGWKSLALS